MGWTSTWHQKHTQPWAVLYTLPAGTASAPAPSTARNHSRKK